MHLCICKQSSVYCCWNCCFSEFVCVCVCNPVIICVQDYTEPHLAVRHWTHRSSHHHRSHILHGATQLMASPPPSQAATLSLHGDSLFVGSLLSFSSSVNAKLMFADRSSRLRCVHTCGHTENWHCHGHSLRIEPVGTQKIDTVMGIVWGLNLWAHRKLPPPWAGLIIWLIFEK